MSSRRGYYAILDSNKKFLEENALYLTAVQIAEKLGVSVSSVRKYRADKLEIDARDIGKKYTDEMIVWLRDNMTDYTSLSDKFNARFGTHVSREQIRNTCNKRGFGNGQLYRPNLTAIMRKRALDKYPIGSETKSAGYIYVKVSDADLNGEGVSASDNWKLKHYIIYENAYGKILSGHKVVFIDQNKTNFNLSNLACLSQTEQLLMTKLGWLNGDVKKFEVALLWVRLRLMLLNHNTTL